VVKMRSRLKIMNRLRLLCVMAGHSRSKNGVAWLAYVPAISISDAVPS
jgi:hypothetical protein